MEDKLNIKKQENLKLYQQIKNHTIKFNKSIVDVTDVCKEVVTENQVLAQYLQVILESGKPVSYNKQITPATFTAIVDKEWLTILLQQLLKIGLLLSNQKKESKVSITPLRVDDSIEVVINFDYYISDTAQQEELFTTNYGSLNSINNLKSASGLEGFIAKSISDQLNIPIKVIPKPETKQTSFVLYISIHSDR